MLNYVFKDAAEWDVILSPLQCQQKFCMLKKSVITTLWCYFSHLRIQRIFMQLIFIKSSQRSGHIRGSPKKVQYTIKLGQTTRCLMHMLKATTSVCLSLYALHGFRRLGILQAVWPRFFKIRNNMRVRKIMKTEVPFLSASFL